MIVLIGRFCIFKTPPENLWENFVFVNGEEMFFNNNNNNNNNNNVKSKTAIMERIS